MKFVMAGLTMIETIIDEIETQWDGLCRYEIFIGEVIIYLEPKIPNIADYFSHNFMCMSYTKGKWFLVVSPEFISLYTDEEINLASKILSSLPN